MSGVRVDCSVSNAPASDQTLRLISDGSQPLCEVALSSGGAECVGTLINGSGEPASVVAELLPSQTQYQVLPAQAQSSQGPALQYTPIPTDTSPPDVDQ